MSNVKTKQVGTKFQGFYSYGGYWWPVKRSQRVVNFGSRESAREAALNALPKAKVS